MDENIEIPQLPLAQVDHILSDQDCPHISIIMPCYQRREFLPLILTNILCMDYPKSKIELCILQDGPDDLFQGDELEYFRQQTKVRIVYKYEKGIRRSIGDKRNRLVKMASHKIIASMDSDDSYLPTYLRYSVSALKEYKAGITSSASMLFLYPKKDYLLTGIRCGYARQGHEACCVFTKKHWKSMGGFASKGENCNQGEGVKMIEFNEKNYVNLDINKLMICVAHDTNTINKDRFIEAKIGAKINDLAHIDILKGIFSQNEL